MKNKLLVAITALLVVLCVLFIKTRPSTPTRTNAITLDQTYTVISDENIVVVPVSILETEEETKILFHINNRNSNYLTINCENLVVNDQKNNAEDSMVINKGKSEYYVSIGNMNLEDIHTIDIQLGIEDKQSNEVVESILKTIYIH